MKTKFIFIILPVFLFMACNDDQFPPNADIGYITGQDLRLCACCGGWFIEIQDAGTRRFFYLPKNDLNLNNRDDFPVSVQVVWEPDETFCMDDKIRVKRIREIYFR